VSTQHEPSVTPPFKGQNHQPTITLPIILTTTVFLTLIHDRNLQLQLTLLTSACCHTTLHLATPQSLCREANNPSIVTDTRDLMGWEEGKLNTNKNCIEFFTSSKKNDKERYATKKKIDDSKRAMSTVPGGGRGADARKIRRRGIEVHTGRECEGACTTKRK